MYEHYEKLWSDYRKDIVFYEENLIPLIKNFDTAIDVGSGSGRLTRWLQTHFKKVVTVDPFAKADYNDLLNCYNMADLVLFGFNTANYITYKDSLHATMNRARNLSPVVVLDMCGNNNEVTRKRGVKWVRQYNPSTNEIKTVVGNDVTIKKYYPAHDFIDHFAKCAIIPQEHNGYYLIWKDDHDRAF